MIKRATGLAIGEHFIVVFWKKAYALESKLWLEYFDGGNWSDGINKQFRKDPYSRDHGFTTRHLSEPLLWYMTDVRAACAARIKP